jgi:hypothetical protein
MSFLLSEGNLGQREQGGIPVSAKQGGLDRSAVGPEIAADERPTLEVMDAQADIEPAKGEI